MGTFDLPLAFVPHLYYFVRHITQPTMHLTPFAALLLLVVSCSNQTADSSHNTDRLAETYARLLILNEQFKSAHSSLTPQTYESSAHALLSEYGLSEKEFRSQVSAVSYTHEGFRQFFEKVSDKLEALKKKPELQSASTSS